MNWQPPRGLALPTVMLTLSLTALACLSAWRSLWLAEQSLKLEADQLRTRHKAQAVLPWVVADILGPELNEGQVADDRHSPNPNQPAAPFYPHTLAELSTLQTRLGNTTCLQGICAPSRSVANSHSASYWLALRDSAWAVNPALTLDGSPAWYWVEVLAAPTQEPPFIYRVTVLAPGLLPAGRTVWQGLWVRTNAQARTGQWRSGSVLQD